MDYSKDAVYIIRNSVNPICYIGSTTLPLPKRLGYHKGAAKTPKDHFHKEMKAVGSENFSIHLLKAFPCLSLKELTDEEYATMDQWRGQGTQLYNRKGAGNKHSLETRQQMSVSKLNNKNRFSYGSVFKSCGKSPAWHFACTDNGVTTMKRYSINKLGYWVAKRMAEVDRALKYPQWKKPEEEAAWEALLQIAV
ncbi:MAG: GIY-YIG nuclease family protein [Candidatus Pacebacteria bacterium]|nr:GIY-YIG nuclease family protein [Candidatus Paceibacterota bacterium]